MQTLWRRIFQAERRARKMSSRESMPGTSKERREGQRGAGWVGRRGGLWCYWGQMKEPLRPCKDADFYSEQRKAARHCARSDVSWCVGKKLLCLEGQPRAPGDWSGLFCSSPDGWCCGFGPMWEWGMCEKWSNSGKVLTMRETEESRIMPRFSVWATTMRVAAGEADSKGKGRGFGFECVGWGWQFDVWGQGRHLGCNMQLKKAWNQHKQQGMSLAALSPGWFVTDTLPFLRIKRKQESILLSYVTDSELGL